MEPLSHSHSNDPQKYGNYPITVVTLVKCTTCVIFKVNQMVKSYLLVEITSLQL